MELIFAVMINYFFKTECITQLKQSKYSVSCHYIDSLTPRCNPTDVWSPLSQMIVILCPYRRDIVVRHGKTFKVPLEIEATLLITVEIYLFSYPTFFMHIHLWSTRLPASRQKTWQEYRIARWKY